MEIAKIWQEIELLEARDQQRLLKHLSRYTRSKWDNEKYKPPFRNQEQNLKEEKSYDLTKKDLDKEILEIKVETLDEFCHVVDNITFHWRKQSPSGLPQAEFFPGELSPWFRGNTESRYGCDPSLLRQVNSRYIKSIPIKHEENQNTEKNLNKDDATKKNIKKLESYLLQRFKTFGVPLVQRDIQKNIQWFFLMQHHLLYTRLLDWSKSSLIALFFAIRKFEEKKAKDCPDAAVWMLEPRTLSQTIHGTRSIYGANKEEHNNLIDFYLNLGSSNNKGSDKENNIIIENESFSISL